MVDAPAIDHPTAGWDFGNYLSDIAPPARFAKTTADVDWCTNDWKTRFCEEEKKRETEREREGEKRAVPYGTSVFRDRRNFRIAWHKQWRDPIDWRGSMRVPGNKYLLVKREDNGNTAVLHTASFPVHPSERKIDGIRLLRGVACAWNVGVASFFILLFISDRIPRPPFSCVAVKIHIHLRYPRPTDLISA